MAATQPFTSDPALQSPPHFRFLGAVDDEETALRKEAEKKKSRDSTRR
jgi:hypothetical protein